MGDILDGDYTSKQISAINNVKNKENTSQKDDINGNNTSIFDDINTYQNDKTAGKKTENAELLEYIDKTMGINNFFSLMDIDGDGKISKEEANKLSSYDGNSSLTSKDINKFVADIKDLKNVSTKKQDGVYTTTYNYELVNGKFVKSFAAKTVNVNGKTTTVAEYTYDENGNITKNTDKLRNRTTTYQYTKVGDKYVKSSAILKNAKGETMETLKYTDGKLYEKYDNFKNCTTTYEYDNSTGKVKSSKTVANNKNKTVLCEGVYENGKLIGKKEYICTRTGLKSNTYHAYEYDEYGRVVGRIVYKGTDGIGEKLADYKYEFDDSNGYSKRITRRTNAIDENDVKKYTYDENNELIEVTFEDKEGKVKSTCKVNPDGSYASMTKGDYTYIYSYDGGVRTEAKKYNKSDVDDDGKVKDNAKLLEKTTYNDEGEEDLKTVYDDDNNKTSYYSGGKLTAETKGDYTYVYEYDSDGKKTTLKYNSSDCENGVPNKSAKPISTNALSDDIVELAESFIGCNSADGSADKFVEGVGDDASKVEWCSEFAKYVLQNSGHYDEIADWYKDVPDKYGSGKNSASSIYDAAKDADAIVSADEVQPGDIVLFDYDGDGVSHTGLVAKVEDGKLYTIEGNNGEKVKACTYDNAAAKKFVYCKVTP